MKKAALLLALGFFAVSAQAQCSLTSVRDATISEAFTKHGGWTFQNFEQVCQKLNRARARMQINAMATVLVNQSIGWAALTVVDRDTNIATSSFNSMNTQVSTYASQDKADELMVLAINEAANNWSGLDRALADLEAERKKARAALAR